MILNMVKTLQAGNHILKTPTFFIFVCVRVFIWSREQIIFNLFQKKQVENTD